MATRPGTAIPTRPPATTPIPTQRAASDGRVRLLALTTALFFVTTVLFALMAFSPSSAPIKTSSTRQAAEANVEDQVDGIATRFTENLITYNYKTITPDLNRLQQDVTDAFPKQFHSAMRGDVRVFRNRVIEKQAVSTGDVKGTTLVSADRDTATVLVFANQTVRSKDSGGEASRYIIIELTVLNTPDGWKVDSARVPSAVTNRTRG